MNEQKIPAAVSFGRPVTEPDALSMGRNTTERQFGLLVMTARCENRVDEIAAESLEMRELRPDLIIRTGLCPARKGVGLLVVKFQKIRVEDESVMLMRGQRSRQETWLQTIGMKSECPSNPNHRTQLTLL
jgi:hypothetical protein